MPKDLKNSQTHYESDGCGEPAHNLSKEDQRKNEIEYLLKIAYKYYRKTGRTPKEALEEVELSRKKLK